MRRLAIPLLSLFFIFLLGSSSGSLGLKTMADCAQLTRASEKIECYHLAGITMADLQNSQAAQSICVQILTDFDTGAYTQDVRQRAELEANDCFFDVAKAIPDPAICNYIDDTKNSVVSGLSGAKTTQVMCVDEATKLSQQNAANYFQAHPDSLCHALFLLPLVLVGAILAGRRR